MSLSPRPPAFSPSMVVADQYVVSYGLAGGLGVFTSLIDGLLERGETVVIRTSRGVERGQIVGTATLRQARLIGDAGEIVRRWSACESAEAAKAKVHAENIRSAAIALATQRSLPIAILDIDVMADGTIILLYAGTATDDSLVSLAADLETAHSAPIRLESLQRLDHDHEPADDETAHGCGKPDCGKTEAGGCSSCSTGDCGSSGGCSSCSTDKTDIRAYFAHLREKAETDHRTSLGMVER